MLDPIFSLRCRAVIEPRDRLEISFLTVVAPSREALLALVAKYRRPESVTRAFEMAWTRAQLEFRYLGVGPAAAHRFQDLASHLLYPNPRLRLPGDRLARNRLGQSALWGDGISGDLPILAVTVTEPRSVPLVRELLLAHTYWRLRGFRADLVILNQEIPSYDRPLHQQLLRQIEAHSPADSVNRPGGVFLRDWHAMPEEHRNLILAASSVVLSGNRGPLQQQLATARETVLPPPFVPSGGQEEPSPPLPFLELPYFNGLGGFTPDGREYAIYLKPGSQTPAPWVNVMANAKFGALVSESGLGFTWSGNSQTNRLTPWHNDPVSDPQSEVIYLRDDESGAVWTPTALPIREKDAYRARHGQGYTVFEHNSHAIGQELTVFVPTGEDGAGDPVKVYRLRLRNDSARRAASHRYLFRRMGSRLEPRRPAVAYSHLLRRGIRRAAGVPALDWRSVRTILAFAAASPRATSYSGDRTQFLGETGRCQSRPRWSGRVSTIGPARASIPPAALQLPVTIDPGNQVEVVFLLGQAETVEAVRALVSRYQNGEQVENALAETHRWWESTLGALQVHTPLLSTDFLLNRWLLYQALSCRFWGRSALYQSSGAFGFRDQLQDSMAFLYAAPELTRAHILPRPRASSSKATSSIGGTRKPAWACAPAVPTTCCGCLTWWRTTSRSRETRRFSTRKSRFSKARRLRPGKQERLFVPAVSAQAAPLWEHCRRAIEHGSRFGSHGLPLFGTGDWNDGMNRVGIEGRGESVWLGWFLCAVLESFSRVMEKRKPGPELARSGAHRRLRSRARSSNQAGTANGICVDSSTMARRSAAMRIRRRASIRSPNPGPSSRRPPRLTARDAQWNRPSGIWWTSAIISCGCSRRPSIIPTPHPGYIMGYPPGLRENGGQYTHGSLWMAMAWARMGDGDAAVHLLKMMNPVELARTPGRCRPLSRRTLRRGGRRVFRGRKSRQKRMDLVHRLGGMDVSNLDRGSAGIPASRRYAYVEAGHPGRLARLRDDLSLPFNHI